MIRIKKRWPMHSILLLLLLSGGCDSGGSQVLPTSSPAGGESLSGLTGTIVMLTNRIDLIENGTFRSYADGFKKQYPGANVEFEGISNYATDILVRLSTKDAGDVLLLPVNLPAKELSYFFEPLNAELAAQERFTTFATYGGKRYGLSTGTTTSGVVYNKQAFRQAGIGQVPQTLDEFYAASAKLKQAGIIPLYMNYGAVWPLREWGNNLVNYMTGNPEYLNEMVQEDAPWKIDNEWGRAIEIARTMLAKGYVEDQLFSNNWEISKTKLAKGEAGMYFQGNWTIRQILDAGAAPEDIGFFPFPYDNHPTHYAALNPDWFIGVSKFSKNKELAMKWIHYFVNETSYTTDWGFLPLHSSDEPALPQYSEFLSYHPTMIEATVQTDAFIDMANRAKLSFWSGDYIQELLAAQDLEQSFHELNVKWKDARN
ncbi:carbohydrate ABC transporter substrate-binding protein [Paenibacillus tritici]|uniref:Carbohydrate ABC transporter substrate-binding protein n=1 Tax=Paenibacillus tritici TaxID=1873425 RepID=A0ABX2DSV9_9BACL|nr:ABC transporter substrate-binding protein [Paenibacillus tritici]NQX47771.1 carbohydrate ABC transporter substrate-binding protein [Paenibacillus tritici]